MEHGLYAKQNVIVLFMNVFSLKSHVSMLSSPFRDTSMNDYNDKIIPPLYNYREVIWHYQAILALNVVMIIAFESVHKKHCYSFLRCFYV